MCGRPVTGPKVEENKSDRSQRPKRRDGLCAKAGERHTSPSIQCSADHISDQELVDMEMLPVQTDFCCSKERVDERPTADEVVPGREEGSR